MGKKYWILEWVAYPFSSGSSWPRNLTGVSCIAGGFFTSWAIRKMGPGFLQKRDDSCHLKQNCPGFRNGVSQALGASGNSLWWSWPPPRRRHSWPSALGWPQPMSSQHLGGQPDENSVGCSSLWPECPPDGVGRAAGRLWPCSPETLFLPSSPWPGRRSRRGWCDNSTSTAGPRLGSRPRAKAWLTS